MSGYARGSEWRKWDLHVHTPSSFDYGNMSVTNENIIAAVRAAGVAVIAITDHHKIDVSRIEELRRLAGSDIKVLVGIELRSELGGTPCVHYRGILPEGINLPDAWTTLAGKLGLTTSAVASIGDDRVYVPFTKGSVVIHDLGGLVIVHAGKKENSIERISNAEQFKQQVKEDLAQAHIDMLEIGCAEDADDYKRIVFPDIGRCLPLIICSDDHDASHYPKRDPCWIKADPTFEGLKQILYEPEERIAFGQEFPRKVDRSKLIDRVTIVNSSHWFEEIRPIEMSEDLVGVIGGKGTGKTALLDLIAYATGSYESEREKSFLSKAKDQLAGCKVTIRWVDGSEQSSVIGDSLLVKKTTRYLSQGFVEQLCAPENVEELQSKIEEVIFQNLPEQNRSGYTSFSDYKTSSLKLIENEKQRVINKITDINRYLEEAEGRLKQEEDLRRNREEIEAAVRRCDGELARLSLTLKGMGSKWLVEEKRLRDKKLDINKKISNLQQRVGDLNEIEQTIRHFIEDANVFVDSLEKRLKSAGLNMAEVGKISIIIKPEDLPAKIEATKVTLIKDLRDAQGKQLWFDKNIAKIASKLAVDKSVRDRIQETNELKGQHQHRLEDIHRVLEQIQQLKENYAMQRQERINLFASYFLQLHDEMQKLRELYSPVVQELANRTGEEKEFEFDVRMHIDLDQMVTDGDALINHKSVGRFYNRDSATLREGLEPLLSNLTLSGEQFNEGDIKRVKDFIDGVYEFFTSDGEGPTRRVYPLITQLKGKGRVPEQAFWNWLLSGKYYSVVYSLKFKGTELDHLSPGLKGVALLILYLELDKDTCPLLIDQPEENLDNRSIYEVLVGYFRKAKKRRQIVVVTHNPNLIVNTDAEQIVVADFDKARKIQAARICYRSGSLENTYEDAAAEVPLERKGIRDHICHILEGGREAFEKRERKYGFARR